MRTSRELSCILWSDLKFVRFKADELLKKGYISFYMMIEHLPEKDEHKKHIHFFCVPDGIQDTHTLTEYFTEFDPEHPDKPKKPADWHKSKFVDAYFYWIHDADYLASKGESREYVYEESDLICSDVDVMHEMYLRADKSKIKGNYAKKIKDAIDNNISFVELLKTGEVPIQLINQYRTAYEMMGATVYRNGRPGHDSVPAEYEKGMSLEELVYTKYGIDLSKEMM